MTKKLMNKKYDQLWLKSFSKNKFRGNDSQAKEFDKNFLGRNKITIHEFVKQRKNEQKIGDIAKASSNKNICKKGQR